MVSGTVKLNEETKVGLRSLKIHFRETYDDVVCRLIEMAIDREPIDATSRSNSGSRMSTSRPAAWSTSTRSVTS